MPEQTECKKCDKAKFTDTIEQKQCNDCETGTFQNSTGSASCLVCPIGQYGRKGVEDCQACPTGFFREDADTNRTTCKSCPVGWVQDKPKSGQCKKCESGKFATESMAKSPCEDCPEGYKSEESENATVLRPRNVCRVCGTGQYSKKASAACDKCEIGLFQNKSASGNCTNCPTGWYQNSKGMTECTRCEEGEEYKNPTQSCEECSLGMYGIRNRTGFFKCVACETGKYQDGKGETKCKDCPKDTYNNDRRSPSNAACVRSPPLVFLVSCFLLLRSLFLVSSFSPLLRLFLCLTGCAVYPHTRTCTHTHTHATDQMR